MERRAGEGDETDEVEVRALRVFLAAADHGSFSAAAVALGTTQPTVSRTVAALEERVGRQLFRRSPRGLELTDAGAVLRREATLAVDAVRAAVNLTRRTGPGPSRLVVAVKPDGDAGLLEAALPGFESPERSVGLLLRETDELPSAVRSGTADVCLVAGPVDLSGLEHDEVLVDDRVAVVAADHPLARRPRLRKADLDGEATVCWPGVSARLDNFYRGTDPVDVRRPAVGPEVRDLAEALRLVELGRAVTFLPTGVARRFAGRRLVAVPVDDLEPSVLRVAWRAGSRDLVLAAFIARVHDVAAAVGPAPVATQRTTA